MRKLLIKIIGILKGLTLVVRPHLFLGFLRHPFLLISNTISLSKWISEQDRQVGLNDFYTFKRNHSKRYSLYQHVIDSLGLGNEEVTYLEFGVFGANSFNWWLEHNSHAASRFYGFDTFEGLPEDWGTFKKGEMSAAAPESHDSRALFVKGLFQDTLPSFLENHPLSSTKRNVIHLDADLFSSTLFVLSSLGSKLKKGDILLFDEFNVPNHEFFAFKIFQDSFYVKTRLLGSVNNYYQIALIIE